MLPVILLLLAGVLDYTMLMRTAISVADAARAGAQFGSLSVTNAANTTGAQNTALTAAPDVVGLTVTAVKVCQCSDGTTVNCGSSCTSGSVRIYSKVTASTAATPIFSYSLVPFSGTISTTISMRAQ